MTDLITITESRCFDGVQGTYTHASGATHCTMRLAVFVPPGARGTKRPVLYWLSGLTCTEENFVTKAGAQRVAAELGLVLVVTDTSPRDVPLPGDRDSYDFGVGAGFYLDATREPWSRHYRMATYVAQELPAAHRGAFPGRAGPVRASSGIRWAGMVRSPLR